MEKDMILTQHIHCFERLKPYYKDTTLLLGDQENRCGYQFGCNVETLDIRGKPGYMVDLTKSSDVKLIGMFSTVFNIGTIEHIFDVGIAWSNAISIASTYFLTQSPVAGWENHGIHITSWRYIRKMLLINGFVLRDEFFTAKNGSKVPQPSRNCGKSILYWAAFERIMSKNIITYPTDLCKGRSGEHFTHQF